MRRELGLLFLLDRDGMIWIGSLALPFRDAHAAGVVGGVEKVSTSSASRERAKAPFVREDEGICGGERESAFDFSYAHSH